MLKIDSAHQLNDPIFFYKAYCFYTGRLFEHFGVSAMLDKDKVIEAHRIYVEEVMKWEAHDLPTSGGSINFYKRAGQIAYWLRRIRPIMDIKHAGSESGAIVKIIRNYYNEIAAYWFGYFVAGLENKAKKGKHYQAPYVSPYFLNEVGYLMKRKHVSPHALYLVYFSYLNEKGKND